MNLPVLGHVSIGGVVVGLVLGLVFANQLKQLPLVNKIPTA
jgi:hypothetical protein